MDVGVLIPYFGKEKRNFTKYCFKFNETVKKCISDEKLQHLSSCRHINELMKEYFQDNRT
jgi:hypothetical protein